MSSLHKRAKDGSSAALTPPSSGPRAPSGRDGGDDGTGPFVPGYVFAGRYRMITRLGRGGMGEVWRADDLVLETPVALKVIYSASHDGRERILNEVRLARQITHQAVCRVFDVGDAEDQVFYTMELVRGEDLATLVRRLGRLPEEKVIDIAYQLCDGLAAAHAQGVLHRDLKPGNVLIDEDGLVRITDFGIAVTRDDLAQHTPIGTPGYMAPEQLRPGTPLSERTDIYALGVLLYELLVGRRPSREGTSGLPPRPSTLVPDVSPQLERAILKALAQDPRQRQASTIELAASLSAPPPDAKRRQVGPWLAGAALAAVLGALVILAPRFLPIAGRPLNDQDTIVLADFLNTTGEPVFDGTLKVALAVALEQSPFLKVFPDDRVRETLGLMQRAPDEHVTRQVAREVARREQLKALVAGSIGSLGNHYVLALEAISAETGDVMAREQTEVSAKEQVLTSLGAMASKLREKLGESLVSIQRFDVPVPRATTASLEALRAYSLALDEGRATPRPEAIPHLKRAIELDPNFALAHAALSGVYANTGRTAEAPVFSQKAFELRNRVSERERFFISWRYYRDAEQAWDKALDLTQAWTTTYPREAFAFNALAISSVALGQHDRAIKALREAIRLDPKFIPPYGNLGGTFIALDRISDAQTTIQEAAAHGIDSLGLRKTGYYVDFFHHDSSAIARDLGLVRNSPDAAWASAWEARSAAYSGRFQAAHELSERTVQTALRDNFRELAAQWTMEDAEAHALAGQCADARREIANGLDLNRDNFTLERAARTFALCGAGAEGLRLSGELARRFPNAILTNQLQLPVIAATAAIESGEPARAIELLQGVKAYDHAPASESWPSYLRGQAYLALKDGRAAGAQFQDILDHPGVAPASPLYPLAHLGLARAATLTGNSDAARKAYEALFALWAGADPGLGALQEARREYARLR